MVQLYGRDGGERVVNGATDGYQTWPAIARLASGGFVVVWAHEPVPGSVEREIRGQLFGADGSPVGGEFVAGPVVEHIGTAPSVAALSNGGFVVTWTYLVPDGLGGSAVRIGGQLLDGAGAKLGPELAIGANPAGNQVDPQIVGLAGGGFAVSWTLEVDRARRSPEQDALVQLFDSAGTATGPATLLSSVTTGTQSMASLAALPGGGFVAAWTDTNSHNVGDAATNGVKLQLFDPAGAKVGAEFLANTTTALQQSSPVVATLATGGFVVAWNDGSGLGGDSSGQSVKAQIFDSAGAKVGGEFLVNGKVEGHQWVESIAALPDGGFVITWEDGETGLADVRAQAFGASGQKIGVEFVVNGAQPGSQRASTAIGLADGRFAIAWMDLQDGDGSGTGIRAQLFVPLSGGPTDILPSSSTLNENSVENVAVATLAAAGGANSSFHYEILADSSGGAFRIEGDRLVVADNSKLDFEAGPQATVTVRVTDINGQTHTEALVLDITDVADEARYAARTPFLVNLTEAGGQHGTHIVALASGGFVAVWMQESAPGTLPSFQTMLRLYDAAGNPVSGEIAAAADWLPGMDVVPLASGGFLILRTAADEPAGTNGIKAQAYDSAGQAVGAEMVAVSGPGAVENPAVVQLRSGGYVFAWETAQGEVVARMFDSAGQPLGGPIPIASIRPEPDWMHYADQPVSLVATAPGGFAAAWADRDESGHPLVQAQFYDSSGVPSGPRISLPAGMGEAGDSTILALAGGGFVLAWVELVGSTSSVSFRAVKALPIDSNGAPMGEPVNLATFAVEPGYGHVQFAAHPEGGFVALWPAADMSTGTIVHQLNGQQFDAFGLPVGSPFQAAAPGDEGDLAILADGSIAALWRGSDGDGRGVFARLLQPADDPPGRSGNDLLTGDHRDDVLDGEKGDDVLYGMGGADDLRGGAGNDRLDGGAMADRMAGGRGDDLYVVDALDTVVERYGEGVDGVLTGLAVFSLMGLPNVENLTGTASIALDLRGNGADNVLTAGASNDFLRLYDGGNDIVLAGAGNDNILFIGALTAADRIDGGDGVDTLVLQGGGYDGFTLGSSIVNIENVSILAGSNMNFGEPGTGRHDYRIATSDSNFAAGVRARINGSALLAGEDFHFDGSAETDASFVIYGGRGVDTLIGGHGADIFIYAEERFAPGDTVNGGPGGYDGLFLRGNYAIDFNAPGYFGLMTGIENITLTSIADERYARGGGTEFDYDIILADNMIGAGATLTVSGTLLRANETMLLDGSRESDGLLRLFGGAAADTLKGGGGADLIHGALGADILSGGGGADSFRYQSSSESTAAAMDHILDFTPGADKIDLGRIDASSLAAGDQAFRWIGSNAFAGTGAASAGEFRAFQSGGTWFVEGDTNGDGTADLVIALTLQGPAPLGAGDFLL